MTWVSFVASEKQAERARVRARANTVRECGDEKSPRRLARASYAVLLNNGFLEDSVTRSQAFSRSRARKMRAPCKRQEKNRESGATTELSPGGTSRPPVIALSDMASALAFGIHHPDGRAFGSVQSAPPSYFRLSANAQV